MPPKTRITRDMIINAAFEIARTDGADNINARTVAKKLGCSTQPVMYHFKTIEELKRAVYKKLDTFHSEYLISAHGEDKRASMGLNYIRFAVQEPLLFKFLFQSGYAVEQSLPEMVDSEELTPILSAMQGNLGIDMAQTKKVFLSIAMFVHGYASIIANNSFMYDEEIINEHLDRAFRGAILAVKEEVSK